MMEHWEPGGIGYIHGVANLRAPEGYREWFGALFRAMPDFKMEIVDMVAYGDKAAVRWRAAGSFTGPGRFRAAAANQSHSSRMEPVRPFLIRAEKIAFHIDTQWMNCEIL